MIVVPAASDVRLLIALPTYKNEKTLGNIIKSIENVMAHTRQEVLQSARVLVVHDGDCSLTREVLSDFPEVVVVEHGENRGKGEALRTAFHYAEVNGYSHVLSMDTDGQHLASDLETLVLFCLSHPRSLVLGDRGLWQKNRAEVPAASVKGNAFSNFWVWLETGFRLPDTQTGLRVYPVTLLPWRQTRCRRFDFEIEILARSAWVGVELRSVPVSVHYPKPHERVSHFHLWKDNLRLTSLHTKLCCARLHSYLFARGIKKRLTSV
jgi:glycosyltransferase involved in cell wall biosynthesis